MYNSGGSFSGPRVLLDLDPPTPAVRRHGCLLGISALQQHAPTDQGRTHFNWQLASMVSLAANSSQDTEAQAQARYKHVSVRVRCRIETAWPSCIRAAALRQGNARQGKGRYVCMSVREIITQRAATERLYRVEQSLSTWLAHTSSLTD